MRRIPTMGCLDPQGEEAGCASRVRSCPRKGASAGENSNPGFSGPFWKFRAKEGVGKRPAEDEGAGGCQLRVAGTHGGKELTLCPEPRGWTDARLLLEGLEGRG